MSNLAQSAAEALTVAGICIGAKDAAEKAARAGVAAQVAAFFTAAGKGDVQGSLAQVPAALAKISDPGLNKLATDLWSVAQPFVSAEATVLEALGGVDGIFTSVGAGMAEIAGAYLTPAKS